MAKRRTISSSRGVPVGGGGHPRASWWRQTLGTDYSGRRGGYSEELTAFKTRVEADGGTVEALPCLETRIQSLKDNGLLDAASAVWLAHGKNANKFYAAKGGATSDFPFTRTTTRTRIGSAVMEIVPIGVPALDYSHSSCPALSLDKSSTNLFLRSEEFDNAIWTKRNSSIVQNITAGPNNSLTADMVRANVATTEADVRQSTIITASTNYAVSYYVKRGNHNYVYLRIGSAATSQHYAFVVFDLNTGTKGETGVGSNSGTIVESTIEEDVDGWYRISLVARMALTDNVSICGFAAAATGNAMSSFGTINGTWAGTEEFYITASQLEASSYPTSYIPTTTGTVSRGADSITQLTGVSSLIGQTEGTIFWHGRSFADGTQKNILELSDGTVNNRIVLYVSAGNAISVYMANGGAGNVNINSNTLVSRNEYKIALTYSTAKVALFINGVKVIEDVTVSVPACSRISFARYDDLGEKFYGEGAVWLISSTAISDATAMTATTL